MKIRAPRVDYFNKVFGQLTVINWLGDSKWECRCSCGNITKVFTSNLTSGHTISCGCYKPDISTHGKTETKEYSIWSNIKTRCYNKNSLDYPRYGGRGITMCIDWLDSFERFFEDMGICPENLSLERIDNDRGYYKENCKWATKKEQSYNRRSNRIIEYNGVSKPLKLLCEDLNVSYKLVHLRLSKGWTIKEAIETRKLEKHEHRGLL